MVQNFSGRILFQEKVKFLKSGIGLQFYASSNKDTFFWLTRHRRNIRGFAVEFFTVYFSKFSSIFIFYKLSAACCLAFRVIWKQHFPIRFLDILKNVFLRSNLLTISKHFWKYQTLFMKKILNQSTTLTEVEYWDVFDLWEDFYCGKFRKT